MYGMERLFCLLVVCCLQARFSAGQMLEGFKERGDGMPYALYILQTQSPRHTDQVGQPPYGYRHSLH